METFCGTVSKLKEFYDSNMKKCRKKKKCIRSHKLKPSNSSADVDDNNNNYEFLRKHAEEMRKRMWDGIKDPVQYSGKHIPYTTLFQILQTGLKKEKKDATPKKGKKDDIVLAERRYMGYAKPSAEDKLEDNSTNELLEEITALKETVDKLGKEKEELEHQLKNLESKNRATYMALKVELESSTSNKMKLHKEIEYLELQLDKSKIKSEMQLKSLEEQVKIERDKSKSYVSEICFTKLKLDEVIKLKTQTEENLKEKIKMIKKESIELKFTIKNLEQINLEQCNKIKCNEDSSSEKIKISQKLSNELKHKIDELETELFKTKASWDSESTTMKVQFEEYCVKTKCLKTEIQEHKDRNRKTTEELSMLKERDVQIEKENINLKCNTMFQRKEIEMLEDKTKQLSTLSTELKNQIIVFKSNEYKMTDALIVKEKELQKMHSDQDCFKNDIHKLYEEMELLKNENNQITFYLNELKCKLKTYRCDKAKSIKLLDEKNKEIDKLNNQKCTLNIKVTTLGQEKSCLQERINELLQNLCKCEVKCKDMKNKFEVTNLKKRNNNLKQTIDQQQCFQMSQNSLEATIICNEDDLNKFLRKGLKCGIKSLDIHELAMLHKSICDATQCLTNQISINPTNSVCCHNTESSEQLEQELDGLHCSLNLLKNCNKKEIERLANELEEMRLKNCRLQFDFNNQNLILNTYKKSARKLKSQISLCICQKQHQQNERDNRPETDKFGNQMKISMSKNLEK